MQQSPISSSRASISSQYHTNTRSSFEPGAGVFKQLPLRDAQLLQDDIEAMDADSPFHHSSHLPNARSFFGALNGYDTDEEDDLRQLSRGYLSSDEGGLDSDDAELYADESEQAAYMPSGVEDPPPPPGWHSETDEAFSLAQAPAADLPPGVGSSQGPQVDVLQQASATAVSSTFADALAQAHATPAGTEVDGAVLSDPASARGGDDMPPLDFAAARAQAWRSPVAVGAAATPAVDARQAMRDAARQHAARSVDDLQHADDTDLELADYGHAPRRVRPSLPTTAYQHPPAAATPGSRPVALSALLHSTDAEAASEEDDMQDLAALVSPCSHFGVSGSKQQHPYATVNPVCEHQTWNLFNSAAAGLLSMGDLRAAVASMRSTLGLQGSSAARQCGTAGGAPPAAASAFGDAPAARAVKPAAPPAPSYLECWQEAVATAQMRYVSERVRATGRAPQTRPQDSMHAGAAVSLHQDMRVTDRMLAKFEESRCWGEVERCAADIAAAAAAEAAAADAAAAAAGAPALDPLRRQEAAVEARRRGEAAAWVEDEGAVGAWPYTGIGVPVGRGVPALAVVPEHTAHSMAVAETPVRAAVPPAVSSSASEAAVEPVVAAARPAEARPGDAAVRSVQGCAGGGGGEGARARPIRRRSAGGCGPRAMRRAGSPRGRATHGKTTARGSAARGLHALAAPADAHPCACPAAQHAAAGGAAAEGAAAAAASACMHAPHAVLWPGERAAAGGVGVWGATWHRSSGDQPLPQHATRRPGAGRTIGYGSGTAAAPHKVEERGGLQAYA